MEFGLIQFNIQKRFRDQFSNKRVKQQKKLQETIEKRQNLVEIMIGNYHQNQWLINYERELNINNRNFPWICSEISNKTTNTRKKLFQAVKEPQQRERERESEN